MYRQHSKNNNPNELNNSIENIYFVSRLAGFESEQKQSSESIQTKISSMTSLSDKFDVKIVYEAVVELLAHMVFIVLLFM